MIHNFGSVEKNDLCFQSQEHISITDSQYLESYVGTCACVNDESLLRSLDLCGSEIFKIVFSEDFMKFHSFLRNIA